MTVPSIAAVDQATLWNGSAGQAWIDTQALLDDLFRPFETRLADAVAAAGARHILDIGCGTGATTLAAVGSMGVGGRGTGVDISAPMIAVARRRAKAENLLVRFQVADAETYGFGTDSCDMVISRFGVMFFANPLGAFANIRGAMAADGALHMIVWRSADENPFMTTAERAAAPFFPAIPSRRADAPGQFAFADRDRVAGILRDGGWRDVGIERLDVPCSFPAAALPTYFMRLGPLGLVLGQVDAGERDRIIAAVRSAFDRYVEGDRVHFTAACWTITARA